MADKKTESRELKPGKELVIAGRIFKGNTVKKTQDEKGKEKKVITKSSTRFVPESLIKKHEIPDKNFVSDKK